MAGNMKHDKGGKSEKRVGKLMNKSGKHEKRGKPEKKAENCRPEINAGNWRPKKKAGD
jgi:hypothetical protein